MQATPAPSSTEQLNVVPWTFEVNANVPEVEGEYVGGSDEMVTIGGGGLKYESAPIAAKAERALVELSAHQLQIGDGGPLS